MENLTVRFVDFEQSCDWNLEIIDDVKIFDFHETYSHKYLHSNIDDFNQNSVYNFGDTLKVEFEVLEKNPYPQRLILCNIDHGIPIKILKIE